VALEPNNTALEFEIMLRRHLARGGAPVSACSGFDADLASAYLESALSGAARASFEAHLAGCPECRRHVIELSRLSQSMMQKKSQLSPLAAQPGWWEQQKSVISEKIKNWAGLSTLYWNWRLVGTAVAACVVLMTVMIAQPWRQSLNRDLQPQGQIAAPATAVSSESTSAPAPTPAADFRTDDARPEPETSNRAIDQRQPTKVPSPKVQVIPGGNAVTDHQPFSQVPGDVLSLQMIREAAGSAQSESLASTLNQPQPPVPSPSGVSPRAAQASPTLMDAGKQVAAKSAVTPQQTTQFQVPLAGPAVAPRITPHPGDNPMQSDGEKEKVRAREDRELASAKKPGWYDRAMGYLPFRKAEREENPSASVGDDETISPLTIKVRDKKFSFQRGIWIDQAYKPEIMYWRVSRIVQGSKEYEQILAEEPQLKEFFSLGKIIIVWRDKVYRVNDK
jgi:anti-sigma factor RsiW